MRKVETPEGRSVRLLRVGEQVRHVLSELLQRGDVHDETLASHLISITEVRMSPDLRHATVFVKPLLGQDVWVIGHEQQGWERHWDQPAPELSPVVKAFQDLTIRKWSEYLKRQKTDRRPDVAPEELCR